MGGIKKKGPGIGVKGVRGWKSEIKWGKKKKKRDSRGKKNVQGLECKR